VARQFGDYAERLAAVVRASASDPGIAALAEELRDCWRSGRQVFLCGNGGSAGNAIHLESDLLYGISKSTGSGLRVHALSANASVLTCLANDCGYDQVFSMQLAVKAQRGDVLVVLSGSGNSPNILKALEQGKAIGLRSYAILGYSGGRAKQMADVAIHIAVDDMQIAEDMQLVVGHMIMQWLHQNPPDAKA
jgi:D-sedoheptulose 7-phosphate isomerase